MKLSALVDLEKAVMAEVVKRRSLGGYNSEAESILLLSETLLRIVRHLIEEYPGEPAATSVTGPKKKGTK
jgi:hypothetical protein